MNTIMHLLFSFLGGQKMGEDIVSINVLNSTRSVFFSVLKCAKPSGLKRTSSEVPLCLSFSLSLSLINFPFVCYNSIFFFLI